MRNLTAGEREEKRQQLTRALERLIYDLCRDWSADDLRWVKEFISNYEFVLALETLAGVVVERSKPLTIRHLHEIDALAELMDLSGNEYLRNLHAYASKIGVKDAAAPSPARRR
jgi:hypothetical protein